MSFRALRTFDEGGHVHTRVVELGLDDLSPGDVVIRVTHSSLNYKDALAVTGRGKILRRFPLVPGIDLAGIVEESTDPRFPRGAVVLANGMGLGERHDGGYAERARLPGDWIVPMPDGLDPAAAMALGTAGFTAALALDLLEEKGQTPALGPIVITGATGGVGSAAVRLLSKRGYEVIAVSGRPEHADWLRRLGAARVETPESLGTGSKPLDRARFGGAIDNVGGTLLASLLPHIVEWGSIVSIGLAGDASLSTTVYPFILRGVSLLGASSANCPMPRRIRLWQRLGAEWKFDTADLVSETIALEDVPSRAVDLLERRLHGRVVVRLGE
ncbi:MAG TPA: YhdH/YhfP family quinone oxidoreductase [Sandaracinaceae bacterium]